MQNHSAENILISALLNSGDVTAAKKLKFSPEILRGYKAEYNYLLTYHKIYGEQPTWDIFTAEFPNFSRCEHSDVRSAVDLVWKAHFRFQFIESMSDAQQLLGDGDYQAAWERVLEAAPKKTSPKKKHLLTDPTFLETWDEPRRYIEFPYRTLQFHSGGLEPGNLAYMAARPGQGKTAHLVNIVSHALRLGCRVRFFSLEMSEQEVRNRFHAIMAHHLGYDLKLSDLRSRSADPQIYRSFLGELSERMKAWGGCIDIHTPTNGPVSPSTVAGGADEYELNVVDYVGLMTSDGGQKSIEDWRVAGKISNALKEIALSSSTAVLAAAQINRDGETGDAPPRVKNLAQSDSLGQDGDLVVTMRAKPHNAVTSFSIEKNRHGLSSVPFWVKFDPQGGDFREVTEDQAEGLVIDSEERQHTLRIVR